MRTGRLIGLLVLLNAVMLIAGLSLEHVRAKPAVLVDFNADKVRLLGRADQAANAPVATVASNPESGVLAKLPEATVAVANTRCFTWPALDGDLFDEIEGRLRGAGIDDLGFDLLLEKRLAWWVYLPPFADAEAARAAIETVKQKGIADIALVRGGEMAHAVSLGAFPSLAKARAHLARVNQLGVSGARVGPRPDSGPARLLLADDVPESKLIRLGQSWANGRVPRACGGN